MKYKLISPINKNYSIQQQILTNRGIPINELDHYLHTTDEDVNPPEALGQDKLREAARALANVVKENKIAYTIVDCDCDGFTSSAILMNYLHDLFPRWVESNFHFIIHDGKQHGLNDTIDAILQKKPSLLFVPDAGSNDVEECKRLYDLNIPVIILDHHDCEIDNPYAIVINSQNNYSNHYLSGAGVTWQFCRYLDEKMHTNFADDELDLVALGLTADMMSLTSLETKHLINKGFQDTNIKNPFFTYMIQKNAYSMKDIVNPTSVAFYVAPYVNAMTRSGTLEEKTLLFESMLKFKAFKQVPSTKRGHTKDETESIAEQAIRTVTNVKARQTKAQNAGLEKIEAMIEENHMLEHKVLLFLLDPGTIDKNLAGLVANKLMAKYQRPVCILTKVESNPNNLPWEDSNVISYQGSARGCEKTGILDFKKICADTGECIFTAGHPNAFGLGIEANNINSFIEKTDAALADISDEPIYYVDYIYEGNEVSSEDILAIAGMDDLWGQNMDEPLLCIHGLKVSKDMVTVYVKKNNTLKITLPNGITLMKFDASDEECNKLQNENTGYYELNVVGTANANTWMDNTTAQLFVVDYEIIDSNEYFF